MKLKIFILAAAMACRLCVFGQAGGGVSHGPWPATGGNALTAATATNALTAATATNA